MSIPNSYKNIAFTSLIRINGRQYEFNFRKPPGEVMNYETDVTDANGERIMFNMIFDDTKWKTHGVFLPSWIEENVGLIGDTISKYTG